MSRNVKNTQATKKPYCKVCFDAGKPESEYSSHWVKSLPDRNNKTTITCPTLLNTECRFCFKLGHTTKFCPTIERNSKEKERAEKKLKVEAAKPKVQEKKKITFFDALRDDSDLEEEVKLISKLKPVDNFPVLNVKTNKNEVELLKTKFEMKTGWAAIAAKPAAELKKLEVKKSEPDKQIITFILSDYIKPKQAKVESKLAPWAKKDHVITKSWADWSDSEDEEVFDIYDEEVKWNNTHVRSVSFENVNTW